MMPLPPEDKAERARERMLEKAKEYQASTYCRKFVSPLFQKMIRAEFGACPLPFALAIVDGELKDVARAIGQVVCITCGAVSSWCGNQIGGGFHTGHFLASRRNSILFEEANVAPQCAHCNAYRGGMPQEYRKWMLEVRGLETVERLEKLKTQSVSFDRDELVDMRINYAARLKAAEERMKG
jgi:hypothetical protein